jgi:hypothetical protein
LIKQDNVSPIIIAEEASLTAAPKLDKEMESCAKTEDKEGISALGQALMSMELYSKDAILLSQLLQSAAVICEARTKTNILDTLESVFQEFGIYAGYVMSMEDNIAVKFASLVNEKVLIPTLLLRENIAALYNQSGDRKLLTSIAILDGIRTQVEQKIVGEKIDTPYMSKLKQDVN